MLIVFRSFVEIYEITVLMLGQLITTVAMLSLISLLRTQSTSVFNMTALFVCMCWRILCLYIEVINTELNIQKKTVTKRDKRRHYLYSKYSKEQKNGESYTLRSVRFFRYRKVCLSEQIRDCQMVETTIRTD